jgi:hypothetical protein
LETWITQNTGLLLDGVMLLNVSLVSLEHMYIICIYLNVDKPCVFHVFVALCPVHLVCGETKTQCWFQFDFWHTCLHLEWHKNENGTGFLVKVSILLPAF